MKKPTPSWVIGLIVLALLGAAAAVNFVGQRSQSGNVQTFTEHDHDHDGKPDHGADAH